MDIASSRVDWRPVVPDASSRGRLSYDKSSAKLLLFSNDAVTFIIYKRLA